MNDAELSATIERELSDSIAYMGGKLSEMRRRNEYYYLGLAKGELAATGIPGRSSVVSTDVSDTVEWMMPSLMKIFAAGEDAVEFAPQGPEDEQMVKQATDYCNYIFYRRNPGFETLYTWIKDSLIQKVGIVKIWWDDTPDEKREENKALDPMQAALLAQDPEVEIIDQSQNDDGSIDVTVKRKKGKGKICIENVPPEEFFISRRAKTLEKPYFLSHRVQRTISELRQIGYKNVDELTSDDWSYNAESSERNSFDDEHNSANSTSFNESSRIVWLNENYLEVDYDDDGITEWRKVVTCGKVTLSNDEFDGHPFVAIRPNPLPHRFFGLCPADMAVPSQRLKTSLKRAVLDNIYLQTNGRNSVVEGQANLDDLMTSRPGGIVRVKSHDAVQPLNDGKGDLGGAMQFLEFEETEKENRTGFTRYSQGADANSLNKTATGISIISSKSDARMELMARCIAEGVRDLFKKMLKLVCQYQTKQDMIRLNNNWVPMDPRQWNHEYDVAINVGLGTSNKDQIVSHLMSLKQDQMAMMQAGVTNPGNLYASSLEIAKNMGLRNPERFYTDPKTLPPPQPPPPDPNMLKVQQQGQMEQARMQMEQAKGQAESQKSQIDSQMAFEKLKADVDRGMAELDLKRESLALDAARLALDREKFYADQSNIQQQSEDAKEQSKLHAAGGIAGEDENGPVTHAQHAAKNDQRHAETMQALMQTMQGMQQAMAMLAAPKRAVRGPDGRISHTEVMQ